MKIFLISIFMLFFTSCELELKQLSQGIQRNTSDQVTEDEIKEEDFFISSWKIPTDRFRLKLPIPSYSNFSITVDWGDDGQTKEYATEQIVQHTYEKAGIYQVRIFGKIETWNMNYTYQSTRKALLKVHQLGRLHWKKLDYAFYDCINLTHFYGKQVSQVVSMNSTFENTPKLWSDLSDWNVSKVRSMRAMFKNSGADFDFSNWNFKSLKYKNGYPLRNFLLNSKFNKIHYSNLLITLNETSKIKNTALDSSSKYLPYASAARDALVAKGWKIQDRGLSPGL